MLESDQHTALLLDRITKRFGDLRALDGVTAAFAPGRIHGVLGENGAGKSTLMRIAAGMISADAGTIAAGGRAALRWSPTDAAAAGIAMVHQHFMLVPNLTVAENCAIGRRDMEQWGARRQAADLVREVGGRTGLRVDPHARVETLSVGEQQSVEIIRALSIARRVLILDEPTAVLTPQQVDQLFEALVRLKGQGLAVAFISHKLGEVRRICDDLTILRRGQRVYSGPASDLTEREIARHMIGADLSSLPTRAAAPTTNAAVLELRRVTAAGSESHRAVRDVDLTVRRGEIVGIAGVEGNGQDVLAAVVVGMVRPQSGTILLAGEDVTGFHVRSRATLGMAHIPEDRQRQGLVPAMTLTENVMLRMYRSSSMKRAGFLRWSTAAKRTAGLVQEFDVRTPGVETPIAQLSGGNQQKLLLARELSASPAIIVAHNPVRGLDIAATQFVFAQLVAQRDRGAGILLIHSDLDELLAIADRVFVMHAGRCIETNWPDGTRENIGRLMLVGST